MYDRPNEKRRIIDPSNHVCFIQYL